MGACSFVPLTEYVFRFVFSPSPEKDELLQPGIDFGQHDFKSRVCRSETSVTLSTGILEAIFEYDSMELRIEAARLSTCNTGNVLKIKSRLNIDDHKICYLQSICDLEEFYGFGLQMKSFAQKGKKKILKTNADPTHDNGYAHAVAPFFVSTGGYGMYFNHIKYSEFDLGSGKRDEMNFTTTEGFLDFYFIYGDSVCDVIEKYQSIIGTPEMPPLSGIGLSYRGYIHWGESEILGVADEFRRRRIPCDYIGLEPGWLDKAGPCSFVWNLERFCEPVKMLEELHKKGFKLNLWEHPWISPAAPFFKDIEKYCGNMKGMGGFVADLTMDEARRVLIDYHKDRFIKYGVDSFKLDECDGSDNTGGWFFPDETDFPSGLNGSMMHNIFGFLYQKTIHEAFSESNKRTFLQCRGGYAGVSRYSTAFYSDLYDFHEYVVTAANSGFTNIMWSPEIRETKDITDFIRRCQLMFFNHYPQVDAWYNGITPWDMGEEVSEIFCKYAELRMKMVPYIYGCHRIAHETGRPLVRALVVDYPGDARTYYVDNQYLFGESVMVAPVYMEDTRSIYLPEGCWTDFWTEQSYTGGRTLEYHSPLERIPLFVKSGAIIPMAPVMQFVGEKTWNPLVLEIYSGKSGEFELYLDDGVTLDYISGNYARKKIKYLEGAKNWNIILKPWIGKYDPADCGKNMIIRLHGAQPAESLTIGENIIGSEPFDRFVEGGSGWSYDNDKRILTIRLYDIDAYEDISIISEGCIEKEKQQGRESWKDFYERLSNAERLSGVVFTKLSANADRLWRDGNKFTEQLFREQLEKDFIESISGLMESDIREKSDLPEDSGTDEKSIEESGKDGMGEIMKALVPVESCLVLENDRVTPENCRVVVSVSNGHFNPELKIVVSIDYNQGWSCKDKLSIFFLHGGASKTIYCNLIQAAGTRQAFLEVKAILKVQLGDRVLYETLHTADWGGYITCWSLLGPLSSAAVNSKFPYLPDIEPDLSHSYLDGERVQEWGLYSNEGSTDAYILLDKGHERSEANELPLYYAFCSVFSTVTQKGRIEAGSTGNLKVWWNGRPVMDEHGQIPAKPAQYTSNVDLNPGWNKVLLRMERQAGETGFYFRVAGIWGEALHSLDFSPVNE